MHYFLFILPWALFAISPAQVAINKHLALIEQPKTNEQLFIEKILYDGALVVLSDETEWVVYPKDRVYASAWLTPANVCIKKSNNPRGEYNYLLKNIWTNKTIRVFYQTYK